MSALKLPPTRVVEIEVHRSKKNPRLGHAIALLFPCNHHKYLGLTLYKEGKEGNFYMGNNVYRTQTCRVIKFEDFTVMDKEYCKLCPPDDFWFDDILNENNFNELVDVLEAIDIDDD